MAEGVGFHIGVKGLQPLDEAEQRARAKALAEKGDAARVILGSMLSEIPAGLRGLGGALFGGREGGAEEVERVRKKLAPTPMEGRQTLENIGNYMEAFKERAADLPGAKLAGKVWDKVIETSPAAATGTVLAANLIGGPIKRGETAVAGAAERAAGRAVERGAAEAAEGAGGRAAAAAAERKPPAAESVRKVAGSDVVPEEKPAPTKRKIEGALVNLNLREKTAQEATAAALRGEHLRKGGASTEGYYVGGPRNVSSPQKLAGNRARMDRELEKAVREQEQYLGPETGDWYASQRRGVAEMAEPYQQPRAAEAEGLFSSQTDPHGELGFHLTAKNRTSLGEPVGIAHTGRQGTEYERAVAEARKIKLGEKTDVYAQQSDPTREMSPFGTNDFRQAQFHGYTEPTGEAQTTGLKPPQHAFIDAETLALVDRANKKKLGGRTDWTGSMAQEIPWVNEKADALMKQRPNLSRQQAMEIAARTIEDYLPTYTASATYETVPGKATGHVPRIIGSTPAEQRAYEGIGSWRTGEDPLINQAMAPGRDKLYGSMDFLQRPGVEGAGVYGDERNVVNIARPLVDLTSEPGVGRTISPQMRGALTEIERLRGAVDAQEAAAWHLPLAQETRKAGTKTHGFLTMPGPASAQQMENIIGALPEGFFPSASSQGVMLFGPEGAKSQAITEALRKASPALEKASGVAPQRIGKESGYIPLYAREAPGPVRPGDWRETIPTAPGQGVVTSEILEGMAKQPPELARRLSESEGVRQSIQAKRLRDVGEAKRGQPVREDIQRLRQFLSEADWNKAVEMIRKGATPAAAVAALGYSLSGMAEEAPR